MQANDGGKKFGTAPSAFDPAGNERQPSEKTNQLYQIHRTNKRENPICCDAIILWLGVVDDDAARRNGWLEAMSRFLRFTQPNDRHDRCAPVNKCERLGGLFGFRIVLVGVVYLSHWGASSVRGGSVRRAHTEDTWADKLAMCKFDLLELFINFVFQHGILNSVDPSNRDHRYVAHPHNSIASLLSAICH